MKSAMYRFDHWLRMARVLIEFGSTIFTINILFSKTSSLGGWSKPEIFLIYAIWVLILCIQYFLTSDSVYQSTQDIRLGDFDWILIKPIDSQFITSFRQIHVDNIFRIIGAIAILIYSLSNQNISLYSTNTILFLFQLVSGVVAFYTIMFMAVIITFKTQGNEQVAIFDSLIQIGKFPVDIFPKYLIPIFWSILPVAYFSVLPTKTLLGKIDIVSYVLSIVVPFILLFIVRKLWNLSLRHYSSASS
jgi:ABC-2 type transport system permease protein